MSNLRQDLRFSIRQLRINKLFSVVAVLTLALGIGATTAIFSVVYGVLLRPLPFRDPQRIMLVSERADKFPLLSASWQNYRDWQSQSTSFEEFGAVRNLTMSVTGSGEPEQVPAEMVSGNLLHLLGVQPQIGRSLTEADDSPRSAPVALLGYGFWQRRFGRSPQVIGQSITLNNKPYTIIGVLPAEYELLQQRPEALVAMGPWAATLPDDRSWHPGIFPIARLKQGVSLAQARAEMSTIAKRLLAQYAETNIALDAIVNPMQEQIVSDSRPVLLILLGAVIFLLLIACANVANLLLTRATSRQREMSIRVAVGASTGRIIQQLLTEGILLSTLGALVGVAIAYFATSTLAHMPGSKIPGIAGVHIEWHVLAFTAAVSILAGMFFGLAPATHAAGRDLRSILNETDRGTVSKGAKGLRQALVISEVALAMLLLIGAGLFLRSFSRLASVSPGFSTEHILIADVPVSPATFAKNVDRMNFFDTTLERLRSLPGVHAAGAASFLPVSGGGSIIHFNIQGRPPQNPSEYVMANYRTVSADYLQVLRIPLIVGRWIEDSDRENRTPVVVINQAMAKAFFPNESPIGKHLQIGTVPDATVPWMEVVGMVGNVRQTLASDPATEMYLPFRQADQVLPVYGMSMLLRTEGDPKIVSNDVRSAIHQVNPNQPVVKIRTMEENVADNIAQPRFRTLLLVIFASVALIIAAVGLYGVMAYATTQRSREIGIRMALGSSSEQILKLILADGMRLTAGGVVIGVVIALGLASYLKSLLFSTSSTDTITLLSSTVVVGAVGLASSLLPAVRASKVQISQILREE
jgi:putative ABC transport system permease protein